MAETTPSEKHEKWNYDKVEHIRYGLCHQTKITLKSSTLL